MYLLYSVRTHAYGFLSIDSVLRNYPRNLCLLPPRPTTQESAVVLYYCYHRSPVAYQLTTTTMIDDIVLNMTS